MLLVCYYVPAITATLVLLRACHYYRSCATRYLPFTTSILLLWTCHFYLSILLLWTCLYYHKCRTRQNDNMRVSVYQKLLPQMTETWPFKSSFQVRKYCQYASINMLNKIYLWSELETSLIWTSFSFSALKNPTVSVFTGKESIKKLLPIYLFLLKLPFIHLRLIRKEFFHQNFLSLFLFSFNKFFFL